MTPREGNDRRKRGDEVVSKEEEEEDEEERRCVPTAVGVRSQTPARTRNHEELLRFRSSYSDDQSL